MSNIRGGAILGFLLMTASVLGAAPAASVHAPNPTFFTAPIFNFHVSRGVLLTIGFLGQLLFSGRVVTQAWASHKRQESYMPPSFWYFSLAAAILLIFYCFVRSEPVGLLMQSLMSAVYARNIYMIRREAVGPSFHRWAWIISASLMLVFLTFCFLSLLAPVNLSVQHVQNPKTFALPFTATVVSAKPVLTWGFIGSAIFMGRFFVQWLASERAGKSIVPTSFWIMASVGSIMLLIYFSIKSDPVNFVGQLTTLPAYLYNLSLIKKKRRKGSAHNVALPAAATK